MLVFFVQGLFIIIFVEGGPICLLTWHKRFHLVKERGRGKGGQGSLGEREREPRCQREKKGGGAKASPAPICARVSQKANLGGGGGWEKKIKASSYFGKCEQAEREAQRRRLESLLQITEFPAWLQGAQPFHFLGSSRWCCVSHNPARNSTPPPPPQSRSDYSRQADTLSALGSPSSAWGGTASHPLQESISRRPNFHAAEAAAERLLLGSLCSQQPPTKQSHEPNGSPGVGSSSRRSFLTRSQHVQNICASAYFSLASVLCCFLSLFRQRTGPSAMANSSYRPFPPSRAPLALTLLGIRWEYQEAVMGGGGAEGGSTDLYK